MRPSNGTSGLPTVRSLRTNRSSSPSRAVRNLSLRIEAQSSDGTAPGGSATAATAMAIAGPSSVPQLSSPHVSRAVARNRSKLGSPRAIQLSGMSYNDGTHARTRASVVRDEADALRPGSRTFAVRRVNSMEGVARLHAARAAEQAAAAAAAAGGGGGPAAASAGPVAALAGSHLAGAYSRPASVGGRAGIGAGDGSDDERGSPRAGHPSPGRHASGPLLGTRLSNQRTSAGCAPEAALRERRLEEVLAAGGTLGTGGQVLAAQGNVPQGLQRWLSHGWRGRPGPVIRTNTASPGAMAQGVGGMTASPSGVPQRTSAGTSASRLLWSRVNSGANHGPHSGPVLQLGVTSGAGSTATNSPAGAGGRDPRDGSTSQQVLGVGPGAEESADLGPVSSQSARAIARMSSLPASAAGAVAAGLSRLAALSLRRGRAGEAGSDVGSREGSSLRHHNPLFLRHHSREPSRDVSGAVTPVRVDSHTPGMHGDGASPVAPGLALASGTLEENHSGSLQGHTGPANSPQGDANSGPLVCGLPTQPSETPSDQLKGAIISRRGAGQGPGPPRMSLTNDIGLHPLLLNPLPVGGSAPLPAHPLLVGRGAIRHPQQLHRATAPSPLGLAPPEAPAGVVQDVEGGAGRCL